MCLDRRVEPGGDSVASLGERHGLEDGPGEETLAGDEDDHAEHEDKDAEHQAHQAAVARAALLTTSWEHWVKIISGSDMYLSQILVLVFSKLAL